MIVLLYACLSGHGDRSSSQLLILRCSLSHYVTLKLLLSLIKIIFKNNIKIA